MASLLKQTLQAIGYVGSNVVPRERVVKEAGHGAFVAHAAGAFYSPGAINPLQAAGGFNSVVELGASTCAQQVAHATKPSVLTRSVTSGALNAFVANHPPTGALAEVAEVGETLTPVDDRAFQLKMAFTSLDFPDAQTVALRFRVTLTFVSDGPSPAPAQSPIGATQLDPYGQLAATPRAASSQRHDVGSFLAELRAPLIHRDPTL